jgi:spore germination protein KB
MIVLTITVLGAEVAARHHFPSYVLAKKINIGDFLQRIEAVMAFMWFLTIYFRMSFYFYAAVIGLAQTLNVKEHRSLVLPLGMIVVVASVVVHPNIVHSNEFNKYTWFPYVSTYGVVLPLVLLAAHALRKRAGSS